MAQRSEAAQVDRELEEARSDLRETLEEVNHKVEKMEARLRPWGIVRRNPAALPLLAGVLGFLFGSERRPRPLRSIAIFTALGAVLAAAHQDGSDGSNRTND
jgi:hypothetical protein